jgi:hypothetical protein
VTGRWRKLHNEEFQNLELLPNIIRSRDSSFSIVTGYGLEGKIYFFSIASRLALEPTQPPIQWVPGAPSPGGGGGVKAAGVRS